jgi:hypothetical protein
MSSPISPTPPTSPPPSLSEYLHAQCNVFLEDPGARVEGKVQQVEKLLEQNEPADAYITLSGDVHTAHLPALADWNAVFRKSYTVLFWLRPRWTVALASPDDGAVRPEHSGDNDHRSETDDKNQKEDTIASESVTRRILYRFSTSA